MYFNRSVTNDSQNDLIHAWEKREVGDEKTGLSAYAYIIICERGGYVKGIFHRRELFFQAGKDVVADGISIFVEGSKIHG